MRSARRNVHRPAPLLVLLLLLALLPACTTIPRVSSSPAALTLSTKPVRVSGPSPYAACTLGGEGQRFLNSEVETWVAVDPVALKAGKVQLVGVWMNDRWSNGGSAGLVSATSSDGGATWQQQPLAFSGCASGGLLPYSRASDPWVSFGPDGRAYASALIVDQETSRAAIGVAVSTDSGRTWGEFRVLQQDENKRGGAANDKETVTADPKRPGYAYAVWSRNVIPVEGALRGTITFAKTTDGGKTWSAPRAIAEGAMGELGTGALIVGDPKSGDLYNFYRLMKFSGTSPRSQIVVQRSQDAGETWTQPAVVAEVTAKGVTHPGIAEEVRTGGALPLAAVDPVSGRLYVAWEDGQFGETVGVALTSSADGGKTWSKPVRVNPPESGTAFRPTVAVNSRGQVGVSYYDFRTVDGAGGGGKVPTHHWLAVYTPTGADLGQAKEHHIAGPFDLSMAPRAPGPFIGDYLGMAAVQDWFTLLYVATTNDPANPTDVYSVSIRP